MFIWIDLGVRVGIAILAMLFIALSLRAFDKLTHRPFWEGYEIMKGDARALAIYYGCRFIGACWLVAFTLS